MAKTYLQKPVTEVELRELARLAQEEEVAFFVRNPHSVAWYQDRFIAAALCQGAALQFISRGYGVADFDIHFFYRQNPLKPRLSRKIKRYKADVGHFATVPIDFVRTVIPASLCVKHETDQEGLIRAFLQRQPTDNARHLAKKAVIGLLPDSLFGRVIWS